MKPKRRVDRCPADRERLAQWMIAQSFSTGHGDTIEELLRELTRQIDALRQSARRTTPKRRVAWVQYICLDPKLYDFFAEIQRVLKPSRTTKIRLIAEEI